MPWSLRLSSSSPTTSIEHESGAGAPPKQPAIRNTVDNMVLVLVRRVFTRTSLEGGGRVVEKSGLSRSGLPGYATRRKSGPACRYDRDGTRDMGAAAWIRTRSIW